MTRPVTVVDPLHPLFGRSLELVSGSSPRGKSYLVVLLPNGHHRSLLRSATDVDQAGPQPPSRRDWPWISVPTILPVARWVQSRLSAMEEISHEAPPQALVPSVRATDSTPLWSQLDLARQQQLAQCLADLLRRIRLRPNHSEDHGHERR